MADEFWFVDIDEEAKYDAQWVVVLQIDSCCLPLPMWFHTKDQAIEFMRRIPLGAEGEDD